MMTGDGSGIMQADKIDSYTAMTPRAKYERVDPEKERRCEAMRERLADGYWHHFRELPEIHHMSESQRNSILDAIGAARDGKYICILRPEITPDDPPLDYGRDDDDAPKGKYKATGVKAEQLARNNRRREDVVALMRQGYGRRDLVEQMQDKWPGYRVTQYDHDRKTIERQGLIDYTGV